MFTDIEGSTRLARLLGDDYGTVLNDHRRLLRAAFRRFGGVELFTEGDSFFIAFGDAASALEAGVEGQLRLSAHEWSGADVRPRVRMGVHTGWARPRGGEYASHEVHRAARVAAAAHGGQILCSGSTAERGGRPGHFGLIDLGLHRLRGFDDHERLFQVTAPGLDRDFPRPRTPQAPRHNLPAHPTPFVGRRAEKAALARLLTENRLVTVAGPGGSGKTRLALAVGEELLPAYEDGVWTIDAGGAVTGPAQAADGRGPAATGLAPAMAAALGLRAEPGRPVLDTLLDHGRDRRMLLLVQTCDAAPAASAALVRRLLAACPRVDVLATSRAPLRVHGEMVWRIPPMSPADVFTLLAERTEESGDLAAVAARLEGSPLAAELAAARLRMLSPDQLAGRLDDPLTALDPPAVSDGPASAEWEEDRHDSLAANLDWSYRALTPQGAALLRRLAVFAGPVELDTVEWCGAGALGALSELADKSLVDVVPGPRYRMSGQVRAYASRRLAAAGDERDARDRHVAWALHTLDGVAVDTDGQPRTVSLTEVGPFVAEWQTALRWAAAGGSVRAGLRLACALDPWWREHGGAREGRDLMFRLYRRLDRADVAPADVAHAYLVHAGLADDRDERTRFLGRAERLARADGRPALLVRARAGHVVSLVEAGRYDDAERLCRDTIALAERRGVPDAALPAVITLAELLWRRDALDEAADLLGGARQVEAGRPEDRGRRTIDWLLGMVALRRRDLVAAHDHLVVALRSRLRHGFRGGAADAVSALAARCAQGGDPATAAVLFGGAEAARGARRTELFGRFWSAQQLSVRTALGDSAFDAAYADGAELGFDRIVAMALAVEHPDLEDGAARLAQTLR